jgi:hypothetical protein
LRFGAQGCRAPIPGWLSGLGALLRYDRLSPFDQAWLGLVWLGLAWLGLAWLEVESVKSC